MSIHLCTRCTRYEEYWEWDEYIFIYVLGMKIIGNGMSIYLCTRYEEYWEWDEYISMY